MSYFVCKNASFYVAFSMFSSGVSSLIKFCEVATPLELTLSYGWAGESASFYFTLVINWIQIL